MTTQALDLQQLEKRAYRTLYDDGLVELFLGGSFLTLAAFELFGSLGYGGIALALVIPLWKAARQVISEPRIGTVRFREERISKERRKALALFVGGTATLVGGIALFFLADRDPSSMDWLQGLGYLPFGGILTFLICVAAIVLELPRLFLYAGVCVAAMLVGHFLDVRLGWVLAFPGAVAVLVGAVMLGQFLRAHPIPRPPEDDGA